MTGDPYFERCLICEEQLHYLQYVATLNHVGMSLCSPCEKVFEKKRKNSSEEELKLYIALRKAHIPATLQHYDGYKTADIAITELNLYIEVDGKQHREAEQALTDLRRSVYSLSKDVVTLRIPNALVKDRIVETVRSIRNLYQAKRSSRNERDDRRQGCLF